MKIENGIRYYEEKERVVDSLDWYIELVHPVDAIAYSVEDGSGLVSIMAEAVTEDDNEKLRKALERFDKKRRILLSGADVNSGCSLLL